MIEDESLILEKVKKLVEEGVDINVRGDRGYTALNWVCNELLFDVAKYLLEVGADPNIYSDEGWTPLIGIINGDEKKVLDMGLIELVVSKGADIEYVGAELSAGIRMGGGFTT